MSEFRDWITFLSEIYICIILTLEYFYDKEKDEKKQKRTRTIKKAVTAPDGTTTTEENIETIESKGETDAKSN